MPFKTPYGTHYHMTEGCSGAFIQCGTEGLEPCSICCGGGQNSGDGSVTPSNGATLGGSPQTHGTLPDGQCEEDTVTATGDQPSSEPTPQDMDDARMAMSTMSGLYATGSIAAPDPSILGTSPEGGRESRQVSQAFHMAKARITDAEERLRGALSALSDISRPSHGTRRGATSSIVRKLGAVAATFAFSLSMAGCGSPALVGRDTTTSEQYTAAQAVHKMEEADSITMRKVALSVGDRWDVYADEEFVATIDGEAVYLVGDTYTLRSTNGDFISSEKEDLSLVTGRATKLDGDGNEVGRFDEEFDLLHHRISFTDENGNTVATIESRFWPPTIRNHAEIADAQGNVEWDYSEDWASMDRGTVRLERTDDTTDVDVSDVVMGSAIYHEQSEGTSSSGGHAGTSKTSRGN